MSSSSFSGFVVRNFTIRPHVAADGNADVAEVSGGQANVAYSGRQLMSLPEDATKQEGMCFVVVVVFFFSLCDVSFFPSVSRGITLAQKLKSPLQ